MCDGRMDGRTNGWTDGWTKALIEMRGRISKGSFFLQNANRKLGVLSDIRVNRQMA